MSLATMVVHALQQGYHRAGSQQKRCLLARESPAVLWSCSITRLIQCMNLNRVCQNQVPSPTPGQLRQHTLN